MPPLGDWGSPTLITRQWPRVRERPPPSTQVCGRQRCRRPAQIQVIGASLGKAGQGYPSCRGIKQGFLEEATTAETARSSLSEGGEGEKRRRK